MTGNSAGHIFCTHTALLPKKISKTFHTIPLFLPSLYDFRIIVQNVFYTITATQT